MASSFVNIKEIGFWAKDAFIEAMQLCLINEIETQKLDSIEWINEFKTELAIQSLPIIFGGMSMELEEFITTDERKAQIIELIDIIIEKIVSTDKYITGSNLYEMRKRAINIICESGKLDFNDSKEFEKAVNSSGWELSLELSKVKDRYQHSFKLLRLLVNGEMKTTASSPETYWNY